MKKSSCSHSSRGTVLRAGRRSGSPSWPSARSERVPKLVHLGLLLGLIALIPLDCGSLVKQPGFPTSVLGSDGQAIILDDLQAIANDASLSDDEKRDQLRALGIEDEELIDALLGL